MEPWIVLTIPHEGGLVELSLTRLEALRLAQELITQMREEETP